MLKKIVSLAFTMLLTCNLPAQTVAINNYTKLTQTLAQGWNTWDTYSQVSYTRLPEGFTINLSLKEYKNAFIMRNPLLYKREQKITLGAHANNGAYTDLVMEWEGMTFRIQSGTDSNNLILLVSPLQLNQKVSPTLIAEAGIVWQQNGSIFKNNSIISWALNNSTTNLYATQQPVYEPNMKLYAPYNAYKLSQPVGLSTGKAYTVSQIQSILESESKKLENLKANYGEQAEIFNALQSSIAWNVIYDPLNKRVVAPVSRSWNEWHGGYVMFCWDTYFVSYMASLYNKELAYANAIAITNEIVESGFVPNFADAIVKSRDRSQPPVGSFCVREIYRHYKEKWFLEEVYDKLLTWNRWWAAKRDINGLLAWGSNTFEPVTGNHWETTQSGVHGWQGASFESGMDNAPMYFNIPFDSTKSVLQLWDVGLNSIYIMDCYALADIAKVLGKTADYAELTARGKQYTQNITKLWDEKSGIYRNRRTDNGMFSERISPTSFYVLLTNAPTKPQIESMMKNYFFNPNEFYGEWLLPSVPRSDTAYKHQDYWQGRIWAPINFLVYLGLRKHKLNDAKNELVEKSAKLLLKNWTENRYVCENYNNNTGIGAEKGTASDPFYHWGALLGFMQFIENGTIESPDGELK